MRATPDFDFALGESATMIRDTVARFADEQIMPLADRIDRDDWFPRAELWQQMTPGCKAALALLKAANLKGFVFRF